MSTIAATAGRRRPSIGIYWARPDRSAFLADRLVARGFPVTHYNVTGHGAAPVVRIPKGFAAACARALRTDHDVYLGSLSFIPVLCLYVNERVRGRPYVFNCTGVMWAMYQDRARGKPWPQLFQHRVYPFLVRRILGRASRIVCNSRFLSDTLTARYPEYRGKTVTVYNGIDAARYAAGRRTAIDGVPPGSPVVVCVTTLNFDHKARGLEVVLDAFARVWQRRPEARLVVAAKVSRRRYAERAEAYVQRRPERAAIVFVYNRPRVEDLLASSDVFAFATAPDSNDSLPRVLLEAQAAGLPCVATGTTGCGEAVVHGETGLIVGYEAAAMATAIDTLLGNAGLRARLGEAGRRRIARVFSWDGMAEQYGRIFEEVAGERAA